MIKYIIQTFHYRIATKATMSFHFHINLLRGAQEVGRICACSSLLSAILRVDYSLRCPCIAVTHTQHSKTKWEGLKAAAKLGTQLITSNLRLLV